MKARPQPVDLGSNASGGTHALGWRLNVPGQAFKPVSEFLDPDEATRVEHAYVTTSGGDVYRVTVADARLFQGSIAALDAVSLRDSQKAGLPLSRRVHDCNSRLVVGSWFNLSSLDGWPNTNDTITSIVLTGEAWGSRPAAEVRRTARGATDTTVHDFEAVLAGLESAQTGVARRATRRMWIAEL